MAERTLIYSPNWLGDCVMAMPAIQMLKRRSAAGCLAVLAREELAPLWRMHESVDEVLEIGGGLPGLLRAVRQVEAGRFARVFILPNSFRSGLIPRLARVPERIGRAGHQRGWLLTRVVPESERVRAAHQAWEYVEILGLIEGAMDLDEPQLAVSDAMVTQCRERLTAVEAAGGWVGLIPGAARGPSKRWPPDHFADLGRRLLRAVRCRVLVFGTRSEFELCSRVSGAIGGGAVNLAGTTSLREFAALLRLCRVVVANDSGGMHLAVAVGTSVVAVFGQTDPGKTGPLGAAHEVVTPPDAEPSREIGRRSPAAERCLEEIDPARVAAVALELLEAAPAEPAAP